MHDPECEREGDVSVPPLPADPGANEHAQLLDRGPAVDEVRLRHVGLSESLHTQVLYCIITSIDRVDTVGFFQRS